jgi:hypothetical protein
MTQQPRPAQRPRDRRRFHRASLQLEGRIILGENGETPVRTLDVSPGGARLQTAAAPPAGAHAVLYLEQIGRLEGKVVRAEGAEKTFAVRFEASARRREAIAEAMILLLNAPYAPPAEERGLERRGARYSTAGSVSLELESGEVKACTLLDVSIVGASLRCEGPRPAIGSWVQLGQSYGRVARYLDTSGFAIDFAPRAQRGNRPQQP